MITLCLKSEFNVHFLYGCTINYNELNATKMNKYHGICKVNLIRSTHKERTEWSRLVYYFMKISYQNFFFLILKRFA